MTLRSCIVSPENINVHPSGSDSVDITLTLKRRTNFSHFRTKKFSINSVIDANLMMQPFVYCGVTMILYWPTSKVGWVECRQ